MSEVAYKDESNVFSEANAFKSSVELVPTAGGPAQPIGSRALAIASDGTLTAGPSPLGDTYIKRNMAPTLFGPDSHRSLLPTLDLLLVGDPPEVQGGRRYGSFPYTPATVLTSAKFEAGTDTTLTVAWAPALVTAWYEAGLIAADEAKLMPDPTVGFGATGTLVIEPVAGGEQFAILTLTSKTATTLTVSKVVSEQVGSLTFTAGAVVNQLLDMDSTIRIDYGSAWVGLGGFQDRATQIGHKTTEVHRRTADGGYSSGGKTVFSTSTRGGGVDSIRREAMEIEDDQSVLIVGGWAEDSTLATSRLTVGGPRALKVGAQNPSGGTVAVDSTWGWPSTGTVDDGNGHVFSYTGLTTQSFTGTEVVSGSGNIADGTKLKLAAKVQVVNGAFRGGQVSANHGQGVAQTKTGNIGPTTATPEGGIKVGEGSGDVSLYRLAAGVWGTQQQLVALQGGSGACFSVRDTAASTVDRWAAFKGGTHKWFDSSGGEQAVVETLTSGNAGIKLSKGRLIANAEKGGLGTEHVAAATPSGGTSGEIKIGNGKIWVNDAGTWKSAAVA